MTTHVARVKAFRGKGRRAKAAKRHKRLLTYRPPMPATQ